MRAHATVTMLDTQTFEDFCQVWIQRRVEGGQSRDAALRAVASGRLDAALERDDVVVLVAVEAGTVVGYAWIANQSLSTLLDAPPVTIEEVYVLPGRRRHGCARGLVTAAVSYAQRIGAEQVSTLVPAQAKDTQRILARLGFAPAVTVRVASTSSVMRKLRGGDSRFDNVLLHRRRSLRTRVG